jgi:hypothetical protein
MADTTDQDLVACAIIIYPKLLVADWKQSDNQKVEAGITLVAGNSGAVANSQPVASYSIASCTGRSS